MPNSSKLECQICGKRYKSEAWLKKHEHSAHPCKQADGSSGSGQSDAVAQAEITAAQQLEWEDWAGSGTDDDEEVESYFALVTEPWREEEEEEERRAALAGIADVDPKPSSKPTKTVVMKCSSCGATFATLDGYITHQVGHGMKDALLHLPSLDDIFEEGVNLAIPVLKEMAATKLVRGLAPLVASFAEDVLKEIDSQEIKIFIRTLSEELYSFLNVNKDFSSPSLFALSFFTNAQSVAVNVSVRDRLKYLLSLKIDYSNEICNAFIATFIQKFSEKMLAHILHVIRNKGLTSQYVSLENRYATTYQATESLDFKQNMHYIGGSNVKSVLRTALRVKHRNAEWQRVIETIRNHFLISEFSRAPDKQLMLWTEAKDRGKLIKISERALEFFVQLGKEVKPLERLDGSLLTEEVLAAIAKSPHLLLRWDVLKGNLSENESLKLLHAFTSHFCVTWRNGIIGRRHDEMAVDKASQKFGTSGVAFRAKLGTSSK